MGEEDRRFLQNFEKLARLLVDATGGRAVWDGEGKSLALAGGFLLITHEPAVVEQVEALLGKLEQYR